MSAVRVVRTSNETEYRIASLVVIPKSRPSERQRFPETESRATGQSGDYIHSGFEAAWELAAWLKHLVRIEGTSSIIASVAHKLRETYVAD